MSKFVLKDDFQKMSLASAYHFITTGECDQFEEQDGGVIKLVNGRLVIYDHDGSNPRYKDILTEVRMLRPANDLSNHTLNYLEAIKIKHDYSDNIIYTRALHKSGRVYLNLFYEDDTRSLEKSFVYFSISPEGTDIKELALRNSALLMDSLVPKWDRFFAPKPSFLLLPWAIERKEDETSWEISR